MSPHQGHSVHGADDGVGEPQQGDGTGTVEDHAGLVLNLVPLHAQITGWVQLHAEGC